MVQNPYRIFIHIVSEYCVKCDKLDVVKLSYLLSLNVKSYSPSITIKLMIIQPHTCENIPTDPSNLSWRFCWCLAKSWQRASCVQCRECTLAPFACGSGEAHSNWQNRTVNYSWRNFQKRFYHHLQHLQQYYEEKKYCFKPSTVTKVSSPLSTVRISAKVIGDDLECSQWWKSQINGQSPPL